MNEKVETALRQTGLNSNEINVYLANLRLGTSRAEDIAKKSGVPRTTTYDILNSLISKGFSSFCIKSGVKHFNAAEPGKILGLIEERKRMLKSVIGDLESIKKSVVKEPTVQMFVGKEGLKSVFDDFLATGKDLSGYGNMEKQYELLEYYLPGYVRRRVKIGFRARLILEKSGMGQKHKTSGTAENRDVRFLSIMKDMETLTITYGNKVAILSFVKSEPVGVVIENEKIAHAHLKLFDFLWKLAKPR